MIVSFLEAVVRKYIPILINSDSYSGILWTKNNPCEFLTYSQKLQCKYTTFEKIFSLELSVVVHDCNPSTQEAELGAYQFKLSLDTVSEE